MIDRVHATTMINDWYKYKQDLLNSVAYRVVTR